MSARLIVHGWAREKANELKRHATRVDRAYTKDPMAETCRVYARALRDAAGILDRAATDILRAETSRSDER